MEKAEAVSLELEEVIAPSEASTLPSTPQQQPSPPPTHVAATAATAAPTPARKRGGYARVGTRRSRARKRGRREEAAAEWCWGMSLGRGPTVDTASVRSAVIETGMVMKLSTVAAASGGLCLVVVVFSGPALVALGVLALGVCGVCYGVHQRGAIEYLPSGLAELLTRTSLLEFLTDTSVFDAIKTYLVFMMGLSEDETQGVLGSLPEDMRYTLTRPGILHTLPRPLQDLLLPANPSPATASLLNSSAHESRQGTTGSRRQRRSTGRERFAEGAGGAGPRAIEGSRERPVDEGVEAPLGQLVWAPLPAGPAPERARARRDGTQVALVERSDSALSDVNNATSEEEYSEESSEEESSGEGEAGGRERERGRTASNAAAAAAAAAGGNIGAADTDTRRRRPRRESSPRTVRSLSPAFTPHRTRGRAATDVGEAGGGRIQPPAISGPARRQGAARWFGGGTGGAGDTADGSVAPSAERLVASILQRRVDAAVRAAWDVVDEQSVRRAAVGSGIALAAHMAYSERARRQAGSMLRGGLLAALAGTATVCAGLAYLKPGVYPRGQASSNATCSTDGDEPMETVEERGVDAAPVEDASGPEVQESALARLRRCRAGIEQWLKIVTPNSRNMIRLLGMICLLLAVRKWQVLRRAALRARIPQRLYGSAPP